jgi:hypothetical protein
MRRLLMLRKLVLMGVVAALAGMVIGGASFATADGGGDAAKTFTLKSRSLGFQDIDLGPKGFGAGDRTVFRDALFSEAGKRVGTLHADCVATWVNVRTESATFRCGATAAFGPHTQIDLAGVITFSEERAGLPFWAVITGGSGKYIGAEGEARVLETGPNTSEVRFRLVSD